MRYLQNEMLNFIFSRRSVLRNCLQLGEIEVVRKILVRLDIVSQLRQEGMVFFFAQAARDPDPVDFHFRLDGYVGFLMDGKSLIVVYGSTHCCLSSMSLREFQTLDVGVLGSRLASCSRQKYLFCAAIVTLSKLFASLYQQERSSA